MLTQNKLRKLFCRYHKIMIGYLLLSAHVGLSYGQNDLNLLFQRIESSYQAAKIDTALLLLEQAQPLLQEKNQKAQWRILQAKCVLSQRTMAATAKSLDTAQQLLSIPEDDLLLAEIYNLRGSMAMLEDQLDAAQDWYTQSLGIRETYLGPESDLVADTYNNLGAVYYRKQLYDEALLMHQQALTIRQKILTAPHPDLGTSYNNLAACYYDLGYLEEALQYNQQALEQRLESFGPNHPSVADSYNNMGNCYFDLYDLGQAIRFHEEALKIRKELEQTLAVADSYNNLGNCWLESGDYNRAINAFQEGLQLYRRELSEDNLSVAEVAANLGNAYLQLGDAPNAQNQLQLAAIIITQQLGKEAPNLIPVLMNQGLAYGRLGDNEAARIAFEQAISNIQKYLGPAHPLLATSYNNLGNLFFRQGNYPAATASYQNALKRIEGAEVIDQKERATCLMNLGNCAFEQGGYKKALSWYQKAQQSFQKPLLLPDLQLNIANNEASTLGALGQENLAIDRLVTLKEAYLSANLSPSLKQIDLHLTLGQLYEQSGQLLLALEAYEAAALLLESLLTRYQTLAAKRQIRTQYYDLYEKGIACAWQLAGTENPQPAFLERAFQLSERSKALLIREASNKNQARSFAGVPDSLLEKEAKLQADLVQAEQLRYEQAHLLDSNSLEALDYQILQQKSAYEQLVLTLEKAYPSYYQLKYDFNPSALAEIQAQLPNSERGLLSFFVGDSAVYAFCLTEKAIQLFSLERKELERDVIQLWDGISNFTSAQVADDYTIYAQIYAERAYRLFQQLIQPIEAKIQLPEALVVVPDGVLCYLPFDLLVRTEVDSADLFRFHQYDYLIRDYQLSYAYSATQWLQLQQQERQKARYQWLGFAPNFSGQNELLKPLFFNSKEVQNIAKVLWDKRTFLGKAAQIKTFEQFANQTQILHLATHGMANAFQSDFAYLAFASLDTSASLLYTQNLYAMQLDALELVVLSACETGLGEAQPGEGIISLAHAFTYAGAASIITTLWSIDDQKTADIMLLFYKNLKKGLPKDAALRQARLDYLATYKSTYAHPFYWAAFVPLGNMDSLSLGRPWWHYGLLGIGILLILGGSYRLISGRWSSS